MQTIYNANGEPKTLDPVDAKEHIETGRWFKELPVVNIETEIKIDSSSDKVDIAEAVQESVKRPYNKKS